MNRLKCVLGINVPRRIPSNTVILKQDVKHMCKSQKSDVCLLEMPPLSLSRTRKISDFRNFHCTQTSNGTVSTQQRGKKISLEGVSSEKCIRKPLISACQVKRPSSGSKLRNDGEYIEKPINLTKKANHLDVSKEIKGSIQKEPRPYAQMIASYNDKMYGSSSSEVLRDNLSSVMINGIHRSPFSTASLVSLKWNNKREETRNTNISDVGLNAFSQDAKFSNASCATRFHFRYDDMSPDITAAHSNELHKSLSYASMIEKYSNAMNLGIDKHGGTQVSKRNMSTKYNQVPMIVMSDEDANNKPSLIASNNASENVSGSGTLTEVEKNEAKTRERNNWLMKMDEIIKDLQRITEKADSSSKWMLQSVQERAYWLDRVMIAHKKKIKDRKEMLEKVSIDTTATELANHDAIPNTTIQDNESISNDEIQSSVQASWNPGPIKPPGSKPPGSKPPSSKPPASKPPASKPPATKSSSQTVTTDKPSSSTIDYMRREPVNTSRITPTNSVKEPQIELRMTPSQNESVVSINVDETATKTAGSNKEQLSVVISSKRNRTDKIETSNANVRTDFGSMQISISESTIPVKQIEFSINGKPVSELKSIVARADKLDVVSSVDKVEIRIPSKDRNVAAEHPRNITTSTSSKPVLNLQIAAKFNEPRFQQPRNAEMKTDPPHMSPPISPVTPTPPTPPSPPVKPHRPQNLFSQDIPKSGITTSKAKEGDLATKGEPTMKTTYMDVSDVTDVKTSENVASQIENTFSESGIHASTRKEKTIPNTMDGVSSNADPNKTIFQSNANVPSNPNVPSNDRTQQPTMNKEDGVPKNRTPSNVIPWWSSEDSFKKIRKKGNTPKNVSKYDRTSTVTATKGNAKATARKEDKSSTDVSPTQQRSSIESAKPDPQKVDNQRDIVTRKPMTKQTNEPDPMINYVRVNSLPRWVPIKRTPEVKTRPTDTGRVVKRARYRVKTTTHSRKSAKNEFDTPAVPTVHCSPKIAKYDSVFPQSVNVEKKRETKASNSKWKTDPEYAKPVVIERVDSHIGRANVQSSNTVYKKEELGGSANRSADVSVKEEKRSATDGTGGKNLSTKATNEDLRIKEILKSMKPIEKKKDGTLIDYGVIIPSRNPTRNVRQIPRILNKTSVNIISKESMQNQEKIVEPEKVSSTKKKTLTEPKNLMEQSKIVEPEKISSAKKEANDIANTEIKYAASKMGKPELNFQDEKTKKEKKRLFDVKKDDFNARKDATSTIKEFKTSISNMNQAENAFNRNKQSQQPISSVSGKSPSEETVSNRSFETPAEKANDTKSPLLDKSKNVFPGSSVTSVETQASEKKELKDTLKSVEQKKAPLEGTTADPSKISDKTTNKVDTPPLMETINFPGSQKSSAKTVKSDIAPLREAAVDLKEEIEKNNKTGIAPLKGTIHLRSLSNQDNLLKLANTDKEKINSELTNQKDKFVKLNVTKKPSNGGGGGNTGSSSPTTIPTGPAGLSMQSEDTESPIGLKEKQDQNADIEKKDNGSSTNQKPGSTYMLFVDRPEKNILYSSWLQRFRNNFDDDKTV
ncbi:titin-like [Bombus pyrosoma]|uniref:titin-like n=1 Tax=Bombus pyrosoma TaxID=396416 RepID=UPI001CB8A2E4|nr:titin-like [Bombus pyrosoma]